MENKQSQNTINPEYRRYLCPICKKHTLLWLLPTTEIKDLPVKCKYCAKEIIVNISLDDNTTKYKM